MEQSKRALNRISIRRNDLLNKIKVPRFLRFNYMPHILSITCVVSVVAVDFIHERTFSIFSFHPLLMSTGFMVFMTLGILSYRNSILIDMFSPIMESSAGNSNRTVHVTLQMLASGFSALGFFFILANKFKYERTFVPRTVHSILGTIVLLCVAFQIVVGRFKYKSLTTMQVRTLKWHGRLGLLIYDMAIACIITGIWELIGFFTLSNAFITIVSALLWLSLHFQMMDNRTSQGTDVEETEVLMTEFNNRIKD